MRKQLFKTLACAGVLLYFTACKNDIQQTGAFSEKQDTAQVVQEEVELIYTKHGSVQSIMEAPRLEQYGLEEENAYYEFPLGIYIRMFDAEGNLNASIKADYSIFKEGEGTWEGRYNVVAINEKGEKLTTEYMLWNQNTHKISSDQFVTLETVGGDILYGDGFVADENMNNWEIVNSRGIINMESNE